MLTSPYKPATTTPIHETLRLRSSSLARRNPQPWPSSPQAERLSDLPTAPEDPERSRSIGHSSTTLSRAGRLPIFNCDTFARF